MGCTNIQEAYRCFGISTDIRGDVQKYGDVQMYGAIQTYGGCMGVYKHTGGHADVWGHTWGVQMYGGAYTSTGGLTDVWVIQMYKHTDIFGEVMGEYRCMGT